MKSRIKVTACPASQPDLIFCFVLTSPGPGLVPAKRNKGSGRNAFNFVCVLSG
jgi:hypothetical protein